MSVLLGTLKYLALKEVWPHEEADFTPWLASDQNLTALADKLGLEFQLEGIEVQVGPYSADILAKDALGNYVVIENQFGKTDHDHLGKLITYGATLGASMVIWIAEKFTEEHQKAVDWLNEHTNDELSLFAVRLEVFRIDDSKPVVQFTVLSEPNEIVRAAAQAKIKDDLSESQQLQLDFWTQYRKRLLDDKVLASAQTARPQYWFDVPLGRTNIFLSNTLNTQTGIAGIRVYLRESVAGAALDQLMQQRDSIEAEIGEKLQWNPNPENRDKTITLTREINLDDRGSWPECIEWMASRTKRVRAAFMPRVKALKLNAIDTA